MSDVVLNQILTIVLIIAVISLIAVLWRVYNVLGDIKIATGIMAKRAEQLDQAIEKAKETVSGMAEAAKGFIYSLGFIQNIKDNFMNNSKSKEEK